MESPKTYRGYNSEGNQVASCTAQDANDYINPEQVKAAIDNVEQVASEQMKMISNALNNVTPDAEEAVIVQGTKMTGVIEEVCTALESVAGSIAESISSLYTESVSAHDEIQRQANEQAYHAVSNASGVVSVR